MEHKDSEYPPAWFRIATKDFDRARRLLDDEDAEGSAFYLQQALEKALKGYLLSKGWKLRRIHDLVVLLNEAIKHDPSLEANRDLCRRGTDYYLMERYPLDHPFEIPLNNIKRSDEEAAPFMERLRA